MKKKKSDKIFKEEITSFETATYIRYVTKTIPALQRQQLDLAQEEIEKYRNAAVEQQQEKADEKARKRHVETNTPEMDVAMIKGVHAYISLSVIDLPTGQFRVVETDFMVLRGFTVKFKRFW